MMNQPLILAIDQGTTSTRAIVFSIDAKPLVIEQQEFTQHFPYDGWVEHDANEIWSTTLNVCKKALAKAQSHGTPVTIGITNQRETVVIWDRHTGEPIANAIVWQDRRTASTCDTLKSRGHEALVTERTGLLLDPYFSGTKIAWLLDHIDGARERAETGELAFGTTDAWLIYKLTNGASHSTDATNACRTLLFDIHRQQWDDALCDLLGVPTAMLPDVKDCAAEFGLTDKSVLGVELPIQGVAGDQHAALVGQACLTPGMVKSTYGTGCFMLMNTGTQAVPSNNRLLSTVGYRLQGETHYALEGAIFNAGTAIQWLRDELGVIRAADESAAMAASLKGNDGVYLVPAFTGLGAPWWDPHARGTMHGLTRDTSVPHLVRAALESVVYQTRDLVQAMLADSTGSLATLRVDGGMVVNDWLMQFMADILDAPIDRPTTFETTALGAAFLAGLQHGLFSSVDAITERWDLDQRFEPTMTAATREQQLSGWATAIQRTLDTESASAHSKRREAP